MKKEQPKRGRDYLHELREEQRELINLLFLSQRLRYDLLPSAIVYDKDQVQKSPSDVFSEKMIEVCTVLDKIDKYTKQVEYHRYEALNLINRIQNPRYRSILTLYYVQPVDRYRLPRWADVARALESTEDNVRKANWRALKAFDRVFTKDCIAS